MNSEIIGIHRAPRREREVVVTFTRDAASGHIRGDISHYFRGLQERDVLCAPVYVVSHCEKRFLRYLAAGEHMDGRDFFSSSPGSYYGAKLGPLSL